MTLEPAPPDVVEVSDAPVADPTPWKRLSARMILVDVVRVILSLTPFAIAVWVVGVEPGSGSLWPVIGIAVFGLFGAITDALRWVFTRYRVTPEYVERRSGILVRSYRTIRRSRIRSVDTSAKLLQRIGGLRLVAVGAGQQTAASESALELDAVSRDDAVALRRELLGEGQRTDAIDGETTADGDGVVLARIQPWWVIYNMFSVWAFFMAAGLLWGGSWLLGTFGFNLFEWVTGLYDWESLGLATTIVIAVVAVGFFGAIGMGVNFFTENWNFELARVSAENGFQLRTRRGLFRTRDVSRDESRMRGLQISEPVLWRWMGMADTNVITTGLNLWSLSQPTAILPRGPISVARPVAVQVLDVTPNPFGAELRTHPRAALRRRLVWAIAATIGITGMLWWLTATEALPPWTIWAGPVLLPFALLGSVISYRALGHAVTGNYLVVRSGLAARATTALRRDSVSTIAIRQSIFQRRLGLKTVTAATAAGYGAYSAVDVAADEAVALAAEFAPGVLDRFLEPAGRS